MYYVYILRCLDNTLYTGITTDPKRRFKEHTSLSDKSAKYTKRHKAVSMECLWETLDRKKASYIEYHIKHDLSKDEKESLISELLKLSDLIEKSEYERFYNKEDLNFIFMDEDNNE